VDESTKAEIMKQFANWSDEEGGDGSDVGEEDEEDEPMMEEEENVEEGEREDSGEEPSHEVTGDVSTATVPEVERSEEVGDVHEMVTYRRKKSAHITDEDDDDVDTQLQTESRHESQMIDDFSVSAVQRNVDDEVVGDEIRNDPEVVRKEPEPRNPFDKNLSYRKQLLREEQSSRRKKGLAASMFDEEAEEEEEEAQAGLGDFGFGRQSDINDRIDENVCHPITYHGAYNGSSSSDDDVIYRMHCGYVKENWIILLMLLQMMKVMRKQDRKHELNNNFRMMNYKLVK
jgi:hypothetical protein